VAKLEYYVHSTGIRYKGFFKVYNILEKDITYYKYTRDDL